MIEYECLLTPCNVRIDACAYFMEREIKPPKIAELCLAVSFHDIEELLNKSV